jgi:hypothetical protein
MWLCTSIFPVMGEDMIEKEFGLVQLTPADRVSCKRIYTCFEFNTIFCSENRITYATPTHPYILHLSKYSFIMKALNLHLREPVVENVAGRTARVRKNLIIDFKDP